MRALLLCITACNGGALQPGGDGGTPPTGLYQVTTSLSENACSLEPQSLVGLQGIVVDPLKVNLPQPGGWQGDLLSLMRIDVPGDSVSLDLQPCGARLTSLIEIVRRDSAGLGVRHTWDWTDTTRNGSPVCALPASPCRAIQDFDFELQEKCEAPCQIEGNPFGELHCSCP
jgi:hypothetical protein